MNNPVPTRLGAVEAWLEDGAPLEDGGRCYPYLYGKASVALMQANEEIVRLRAQLARLTAELTGGECDEVRR